VNLFFPYIYASLPDQNVLFCKIARDIITFKTLHCKTPHVTLDG
jgi:hypothetical protein